MRNLLRPRKCLAVVGIARSDSKPSPEGVALFLDQIVCNGDTEPKHHLRMIRGMSPVRRARIPMTLVSVGAALAGAIVFATGLYVAPLNDSVDQVDAVFVLGLPTRERIMVAREVSAANDGAPILVSAPGMTKAICQFDDVECFEPDVETTKGEAQLLANLSAERGYENPAVVTFTPQVSRARIIFRMCFDADTPVVGAAEPLSLGDWAYQFAYQSAAMIKAVVTDCDTGA